jgi:hypothetical protein
MSEETMTFVGDAVVYVDEHGAAHDALVTAYHGKEGEQAECAVNLVYIGFDPDKRDPYGRQLERASSVSYRREGVTAHGRYWYRRNAES